MLTHQHPHSLGSGRTTTIFESRYRIDTALDVWSFAVVIFIVLFNQEPCLVASREDRQYNKFVTNTLHQEPDGGEVDDTWAVLHEPFRKCLFSMFDVSFHLLIETRETQYNVCLMRFSYVVVPSFVWFLPPLPSCFAS